MLIVLFIIGSVIFILGLWLNKSDNDAINLIGLTLTTIAVIFDILLIIYFIFCLVGVSKTKVIDEKIDMYQKENQLIEKQITEIVSDYKNYEKETINNTGKMATILIKFPELKSNKLVSKQIDVYVKNNDKIKELKEEKIDYQVSKWWLYFGGKE